MHISSRTWLVVFWLTAASAFGQDREFLNRIEHGFAENDGVSLHYVRVGEGPVALMLHGFPDFWYTWRGLMEGLSDRFTCVAVDLRGYNGSDKPQGVEQYRLDVLMDDVDAVLDAVGAARATVIGHDWGGLIGWHYAAKRPERVERLVVLSLPHPVPFSRELVENEIQQENAENAQRFKEEGFHGNLTNSLLLSFLPPDDAELRNHYLEALRRSDKEAMLNYYAANYPDKPYELLEAFPRISCPVLQVHGLEDSALHPNGLRNTWEWIDAPYALVTLPGVGHWAHRDAPGVVLGTIRSWLMTPAE